MRFFALLALATVAAADQTCTESIVSDCTPAFFFDGDDSYCYHIDLAKAELYKAKETGACNYTLPYDFTAATKVASNTDKPYKLYSDALQYYGNNEACGASLTYKISFVGAETNTNPAVAGTECAPTISIPVPASDPCPGPASNGNSYSSRRGRFSGRRNSGSSTTNDGERRGGCAEGTNPLFPLLNYSTAPCQMGQCCGDNFCNRDRTLGDCLALGNENLTTIFTPGSKCDDSTCVPVYPGTGSGANGGSVQLGSSLTHAVGALPVGGYLEVVVKNVNTEGEVPANANGANLVAFVVNRRNPDDSPIEDYLPTGTWIEVTVESDSLVGGGIVVWRWDEVNSVWIDSAEDCAHISSNVDITIDGTVYTVPICHTSLFAVTASTDGDDKDDTKKHAKVSKKAPKSKVKTVAKATKAPKAVSKKEAKAKGKKAEIAAGVGVAGAAVVVAGVGFLVHRRNKGKKSPKATSSPATAEVAVVSV